MRRPSSPAARPSVWRTAIARGADVPVVVWLGFAAFIGLGLPEATLGVTWPSIRADFDRPLSALGILLGSLTAGYLPASALSGRVVARLGAGRMLALASAVYVAAMALYVLAPSFAFLVIASFLGGVAAGTIDPGLNAHFALHHGTRAMNLLHASFGIGATAGPFVATVVVGWGGTWRIPYAVYLVVHAALLLGFVATRDRWSVAPAGSDDADRDGPGAAEPTDPRPVRTLAALSILNFFLYTGLEVGSGVLAFTLLSEGRGYSDATAGFLATSFWAGLTIGRAALGVAGKRLTAEQILRGSVLGAVVATALVWSDPGGAGAAAFPVLGLCLAGIFPSLVLLTPLRVGPRRTADLVGVQFSVAAVGASGIPAAISVLAEDHLERIGPSLFALALAVAVLDVVLARLAGSTAAARARL